MIDRKKIFNNRHDRLIYTKYTKMLYSRGWLDLFSPPPSWTSYITTILGNSICLSKIKFTIHYYSYSSRTS